MCVCAVYTVIYKYMDVYAMYRWIDKQKNIKKDLCMYLGNICIYRYAHAHTYIGNACFYIHRGSNCCQKL